jgi:hypothetical protein
MAGIDAQRALRKRPDRALRDSRHPLSFVIVVGAGRRFDAAR